MSGKNRGSPAAFYAEMIYAGMQNLPYRGEDEVDLQSAVGLSNAEFDLGVKWFMEHSAVFLTNERTARYDCAYFSAIDPF
jgi:hypothetical protein